MKHARITALFVACALLVGAGTALAAPSTKGARVYFISPRDGAHISGPVTVRFGLQGMGVAPAGTDKPGTGHHHLIIDSPLPPLDEAIPKDGLHRHFGGGQTETILNLPAGTHSLQLLLGDMNHIPHQPPLYSKKITVTVNPE